MNVVLSPQASKVIEQISTKHGDDKSQVEIDPRTSLLLPGKHASGKRNVLKNQDKDSEDGRCFVKGYN